MDAILQRREPKAPGWPVLGGLSMPSGAEFVTLEDPYILLTGNDSLVPRPWPFISMKLPGVTAIPAGRYRLIVGWSTRFQKDLPRLLDVPGFTGILIHAGNWQEDTQGCILVGTDKGPDGRSLLQSAEAVLKVTAEIRSIKEPLYIDVRYPKG